MQHISVLCLKSNLTYELYSHIYKYVHIRYNLHPLWPQWFRVKRFFSFILLLFGFRCCCSSYIVARSVAFSAERHPFIPVLRQIHPSNPFFFSPSNIIVSVWTDMDISMHMNVCVYLNICVDFHMDGETKEEAVY
jgi:hypothetical protein